MENGVTPAARELVPGDVIRLRSGDIVPADARLLEGDPVEVDQSALTGESLPVTKKSGEAVFSGSIVRQGEIEALSLWNWHEHLLWQDGTTSGGSAHCQPFSKSRFEDRQLPDHSRRVLVAGIITVAIFRGDPILTTLQFALVLTVASIPVAMPTVLSVTMAVGARLLAKKEAIVSRLVAIEELAGVDILCADKTGTLTQNKLTLGDPFSVNNIPAEQVILNAALASRAENNDTIDLAVLGGLKNKDALKGYQMVHFQPFDAVHKRTEATIKDQRRKRVQSDERSASSDFGLVGQCRPSEGRQLKKPSMNSQHVDFVRWAWRGPMEMADGSFLVCCPCSIRQEKMPRQPLRPQNQMGVKVKMVTGDQLAIAKETAKKLGMGTNILDATGLGDVKSKRQQQVAESIEKADGFAQVFPEHKFHIVDVLQKRGHIVGMTGDGVNDAPALKKADCGIAVSSATDAARAAAAIVLLTPGLSVIIDAIKESRHIFQRMNSYAIYRIAETLRVLFFMTLAILIFNFYPLTAVMIVMLALLNDGAILSIAYDNVHYKNQPEGWNMRMVLGIATALGLIGVVAAFGLFYLGERVFHLDRPHIQTLMYLKLSVAGHLTIFLTRTRGPFWSIRPARILWGAVLGTQIIATLIAVYGFLMTPLGWKWAGFVWGYAIAWFLINDQVKWLAYRIFDPAKKAKSNLEGTVKLNPEAKTDSGPENKTLSKSLEKVGSKSDEKDKLRADPKKAVKPDGNTGPRTDIQDEPKPEVNSKPDAMTDNKKHPKSENTTSDKAAQIAKRAYELYELRGRQDGHADQDWSQAEKEIEKE